MASFSAAFASAIVGVPWAQQCKPSPSKPSPFWPHLDASQLDRQTTVTVIVWKSLKMGDKGHVALQTYVGAEDRNHIQDWTRRGVFNDHQSAHGFYMSFYPGSPCRCQVENCRQKAKKEDRHLKGHFHSPETDVQAQPLSEETIGVFHLTLDVEKVNTKIRSILKKLPVWSIAGSGPFGMTYQANCAGMTARLLKAGGFKDLEHFAPSTFSFLDRQGINSLTKRSILFCVHSLFFAGVVLSNEEYRTFSKRTANLKADAEQQHQFAQKLFKDSLRSVALVGSPELANEQRASIEYGEMLQKHSSKEFDKALSSVNSIVKDINLYRHVTMGAATCIGLAWGALAYCSSRFITEAITPEDVLNAVKYSKQLK